MSINPIRKSKSKYNHQKQSTKSGNEDNSPEEEELKKYRELIEKLSFIHQKKKSKDKSAYLSSDSVMETNNINISSNIRRTTSRTKEILNDRDFLLNFMNYESMPILPKNMHLLTDNDTNQNIDEQTKFKNLSDLLLDDKESVIESDFIKKTEEKMILKLYTALSRRSKDIFMEENDNNYKKNKNRILFHKINNIEIPHFKILDKDDINNNEININNDNNNVEPIFNNLIKNNKKSKTPQKESNYDIINNININPDINYNTLRRYSNMNIITELNKDKLQFNSDCLYNKKNNTEKTIKIPTLENYKNYRSTKNNTRKNRKINNNPFQAPGSWEPNLDCDLLAYINHNIIKIEDIYNKGKENVLEFNDDIKEEDIKTMEAKEVYFDLNQKNNNNNSEKASENMNLSHKENSNISDEEEENELKNKNKFCEYKDRLPNLIEISLLVDPNKKKDSDFHKELKELYSSRINEVTELGEELFPFFGKDLKANKIYKFVKNNERNEEINTDSFTLFSNQSTDININKNNINNNNENNNNILNDSFPLSINEKSKDNLKLLNGSNIVGNNNIENNKDTNSKESKEIESSKENENINDNNEEFNKNNNSDNSNKNTSKENIKNQKELILNLSFSKNSSD
jgi:hypothetical protein